MSLSKNSLEDRINYFFNSVNISGKDEERAKNAILSKGIEKHIIILERLKAWSQSDKVDYRMIASVYRYDKRLRNVLFKFISYLEEYYRSIILDLYRFDWSKIELNGELKSKLEKHKDLNVALEDILFSSLTKQIRLIKGDVVGRFLFPNDTHLTKNFDALIELRNSVMHNKLLVLYHGFKECFPDDDELNKSATLKSNILNLIRFLPEEIRNACRQEIKDCAKERNNDDKTEWMLPPFVVIDV